MLSIGEFAAATQLSQKALRIYAEQRLLPPARIDTATGYRYYSSEQVPLGRLVRTLREMNLSLTDIASVVASKDGGGAETLLAQLAQQIDEQQRSGWQLLRYNPGRKCSDVLHEDVLRHHVQR